MCRRRPRTETEHPRLAALLTQTVICLATFTGVLGFSASSLLAQTLHIDATSNVGSLDVSLSGIAFSTPVNLSVPGIDLTLPVSGLPLNFTADLPAGFAVTGVNCAGGAVSRLGRSEFQVQPTVGDAISCTVATVNALGESVGAILPLLERKNDVALTLELGLDHQIDRFFPSAGETSPAWPKPYGLGASTPTAPDQSPGNSDRSSIVYSQPNQNSRYGLGSGRGQGGSSIKKFSVWAEGYYYDFDQTLDGARSSGHAGVLYLGADYLIAPWLSVGAMVQFDDTDQSYQSSNAKDQGWMAGPYAMLRLSENIFLQARAAGGTSDNSIKTDSGLDDHFDSDRWLAKSTLLGRWRFNDWQFSPRASIGYIEEHQAGFEDSLGVDIPGHVVSLGQAKVGPEVSLLVPLKDGSILQPSLLMEGIWNFHQSSGSEVLDDMISDGTFRGRTEAGLTWTAANGLAVSGSVSYDGIGSSLDAVGGKFRVRAPFN
jgi:outer membrane autotransporter protein